ncbi:MAG TPA: hypothetical protein VFO00_00020 [Vitreimonas sp.]|nr:hypothetical protein [Vitreimonas sp.]
MSFSPEGLFHAAAGVIGIVAGIIAILTRKGGRTHVIAGRIFVGSIVLTALSAIRLALKAEEFGFIGAGVLVVYFMLTAWMAVRRPERQSGLFEIGAFLVAAAGAAAMYVAWLEARQSPELFNGLPILIFAIVATLCALGDLSVVLRRGLAGKQRIMRHLWRMHLGFFAAVGSFFPGQLEMFPAWIQQIRPIILLFIPPFTVAGIMLIFLAYVVFSKRFAARAVA